ncbi:MAG: hypothetical protein HQK50_13040 [Oligoflexia bacterium]|nr:hypothetical protein [Oligoflexia bacterium]
MLKSLEFIEKEEKVYLGTGEITAADIASIKSRVYANLAESGYVVSEVPIVAELFASWLDNETSILTKKISILQQKRKLELLIASLKTKEDAIKNIEERKNIHQIYKLWAVDDLDINEMGSDLNSFLFKISNNLLPVVNFYDKSIFSSLALDIDSIKKININTSILDISKKISSVVKKINFELEKDKPEVVPDSIFTIAIYYPNPFAPKDVSGKPSKDQSCNLYLLELNPEEVSVDKTPSLVKFDDKLYSIIYYNGKTDVRELSLGVDELQGSILNGLIFDGRNIRLDSKQCSYFISVGGHSQYRIKRGQSPNYFNKYPYPTADLAIAHVIWEKLYDGETAINVVVSPDQIYTQASKGILRCQYSRPTIESMGIHFVYEDEQDSMKYNSTKFTVQSNTVGPMAFPGQKDIDLYKLIKNSWKNFEIPLTFGPLYGAPTIFDNRVATEKMDLGSGRSPFTNFIIDSLPISREIMEKNDPNYYDSAYLENVYLKNISGFILFFQVRPIKTEQPIKSVQYCK